MWFYGIKMVALPDLIVLLQFIIFIDLMKLLSHVLGVLGLGFLKLGKFFTRMLRLRMTLGSLVFRPIVRDFTLAAGIHSLFSSSLKPVKKNYPSLMQYIFIVRFNLNLFIKNFTLKVLLYLFWTWRDLYFIYTMY